ncbi:MAG: hypothetical protein FWD09_00305 [Lentimicrobiaceae bacterium]|nr:hypothetical protein [Lentimicrobiaceae bacterium]
MDTEQIIFLLFAIAISIFSLYIKSKKKKQSSPERAEESYHDFPQEADSYNPLDPVVIFRQYDVHNSPQNADFYTKTNKKNKKTQNTGTVSPPVKTSENISQNIDSENNIVLLEGFEGTELQRAFLFSEIFKNTKS